MSQRTFRLDLADYLKRAARGDPSAPQRWERLKARHGMYLDNWLRDHTPPGQPTGERGRPRLTLAQRHEARAERKRHRRSPLVG